LYFAFAFVFLCLHEKQWPTPCLHQPSPPLPPPPPNLLIYDRSLNQIETFYKKFYTFQGNFSDEECDSFIRDLEIPTLKDEDRNNLEGPLTYDECRKELETFQNDKAPGEGGFTIEFHKYFLNLLGNDLPASLNEAHAKCELSISQRRGIIMLTPKEDATCQTQTSAA